MCCTHLAQGSGVYARAFICLYRRAEEGPGPFTLSAVYSKHSACYLHLQMKTPEHWYILHSPVSLSLPFSRCLSMDSICLPSYLFLSFTPLSLALIRSCFSCVIILLVFHLIFSPVFSTPLSSPILSSDELHLASSVYSFHSYSLSLSFPSSFSHSHVIIFIVSHLVFLPVFSTPLHP